MASSEAEAEGVQTALQARGSVSSSQAESTVHENVMTSRVTLPVETGTSLRRGRRVCFDDKDLEKACLEQEINDLKAESTRMQIIHQAQLNTMYMLRTNNQSLEKDLARAKQKIATLEKQLAIVNVKTIHGQADKFSFVSKEGIEALFGSATDADVRPE